VNANALKRWPGWAALLLVLVALLTIGVTRDGGPRTQQDRVDSISKRLACPTCDGESIYESRSTAAEAIRVEVARQVALGVDSDQEVIESIDDAYAEPLQLTPDSSGFEALIWVLPVALLLMAMAGLVVAFRRWRHEGDEAATDEDRELVAAALLRESGPDAGGDTE
jgi:cytochrome c-type biogenesis protein CcmH